MSPVNEGEMCLTVLMMMELKQDKNKARQDLKLEAIFKLAHAFLKN